MLPEHVPHVRLVEIFRPDRATALNKAHDLAEFRAGQCQPGGEF
jgi:hypothetical protein